MVDKKIMYITDILGVTDSEIAKRGGLAKESMSRIRSGSRILKKNSKQMARLINGIYSYSVETGLLKRLCIVTDCMGQNEEDIKEGLLDWFFDGVVPPDAGPEKLKKKRPPRRKEDPGSEMENFGSKLKSLMGVAGVTNIEVAERAGISTYYISHIRSGARPPRANSATTEKICSALAEIISENGTFENVVSFIGKNPSAVAAEDLSGEIRMWLCGVRASSVSTASHANAFIERMKSLASDEPSDMSDIIVPEIETSGTYTGNEGFRNASLRFLGDCIRNAETEIFLYSDQSMDWITDDYVPVWFTQMSRCLRNGIKIRMIHNIERNSTEMFEALNSWLPLYMTGLIDPYYCSRKVGERFANTIFLSSGACVRGTCVRGNEDSCVFEYHTDRKPLEADRRLFDELLDSSLPLLTFSSEPTHLSGNFRIHIVGDVEICLGKDCVIVNRLTSPAASFTLRHPLMLKAFREFADENNKRNAGQGTSGKI